jgi:hypothetical protein
MNIRNFNELSQVGDESNKYVVHSTKMILRAVYV